MLLFTNPRTYIARARRRGEVGFVKAVGEILDRADQLAGRGAIDRALPFYAAVAALSLDDRLVTEAVDHARRTLERLGVQSEPSVGRTYEAYLDSLRPFERHLMLARQALRAASSVQPGAARANAVAEAIKHFEAAASHGSLSGRDRRILEGLRSSLAG